MSDKPNKDPIGTLIREMDPLPRLKYTFLEFGHAYVNVFTEAARKVGLPGPQGIGKFISYASVIVLIAIIVAMVAVDCDAPAMTGALF